MADLNYADLSDEDLDRLISSGELPSAAPPRPTPFAGNAIQQARMAPQPAEEKVDTSYGMPGWQLALAGAGAPLADMLYGTKEKLQLLTRPEGQEGEQLAAQIATDRASRERAKKDLYKNPEAIGGRIVGEALPAIAAPARLPFQIGLQGVQSFLKPGQAKPRGLGSELVGSGANALTDMAATYAIGKPLEWLGKTYGAARNDLTEEGVKALATKQAAERLGLPPTSLGQIYPHSPMASIEKGAPGMGYADRTYQQAKALRDAISGQKAGVEQVGSKYADDLAEAARNRLALASGKYQAVDDFVAGNNLPPLNLMYTARTATSTNTPGYQGAAALLDDYGFPIGQMAGMKASELAKSPVKMTEFHAARVAVNKALGRVNQDVAREGSKATAELRQTQSFLKDMKNALDNDLARWGKQASGNQEAVKLFKEANDYYRDVAVPTVLDNRLARKAMSKYRGFESPRQALGASQSELGAPLVDLLYPTMGQRGRDVTDVLRNMPDLRKTILNQDLAVPVPEGGGLLQAGKAMLGHPVTAAETAISRVPGLRALAESTPAAKLYGARNVLQGTPAGRAAFGVVQSPERDVQEKLRELTGQRPRP